MYTSGGRTFFRNAPGAAMKRRNGFRPTVESLESVNLLGHMTFATPNGEIFARTITAGAPGERTFSYVITCGTGPYLHASGHGSITPVQEGWDLNFVFA
jgi:hypothetical protein